MSRSILAMLFTVLSLAVAANAQTQPALTCNLGMVVDCANGLCTATTTNNGSNACSGTIGTGFEAMQNQQAMLIGFNPGISLPQCYDSNSFPGTQSKTPIVLCFGPGSLAPGSSFSSTVTVSAAVDTPIFAFTVVLDAITNKEVGLAYALSGSSSITCTPAANVASATLTGVPYTVSWTPVGDPAATYIVEESTTPDFSAITSTTPTSKTSAQFQHSVTATTTFYYRVRATTCSGQPGTNSSTVSIVIQVPPQTTSGGTDVVVPFGTTTPFLIPLTIQLPTTSAGYGFTATTDKLDFYSVLPAAGTVPQNGQLALLITASPASLPPGASTGTLLVTTTPPLGKATSLGGTTTALPVSVSLVTPVTPGGKSLPPPNALIIPVVAHAIGGGNTPFVADVRLTNGSSGSINYQVTYTATVAGTVSSKITNITVGSGQTVALNDIAKDFFGVGATGNPTDGGSGAVEIRPLTSASTATYASSRNYGTTSYGTFGQFVAAIPFSQFATQQSFVPPIGGGTPPVGPPPLLSLQQVAQSTSFRTNLGLVEGSGTTAGGAVAASGTINVYKDDGTLVASGPFALQPGEQVQKPLGQWVTGLPNLDDGRIEIKVTSPTGAVSGYASVLDNVTQDPLAVTPVVAASVHSTRYVIPGIAEYVFSDGRNFHSDMRIFNGGASDSNVTLTFYPSRTSGILPPPVPLPPFTIPKGQVQRIDDVLASFFKLGEGANVSGSVVITTATDSSLVVTGRTFSNDRGGTFGQFIPGVMPSQGIATGDRPLQILQLEQSQQFRSNIGIAEVSGNPVDGQITIIQPDSKVAPVVAFHLEPNEFQQLPMTAFLPAGASLYNARAVVEVTGGSGRLTSYGSVIDNMSTDPTYVPAQ